MVLVVWDWAMQVPKLRIRIIARLNFSLGKDLTDCLFSSYLEWHPLTHSIISDRLEHARKAKGQSAWLNQDLRFHKIPRWFVCTQKSEKQWPGLYPSHFHASFKADMHILYFHESLIKSVHWSNEQGRRQNSSTCLWKILSSLIWYIPSILLSNTNSWDY